MTRRWRSLTGAVTARRLLQLAFLLGFLAVIVGTQAHPGGQPPSAWLQIFFWVDPLLLVVTWLSAHAVPTALLASLGLLAVTVVLGRVFCGWACPLGTVHALAGRLLVGIWPDRSRATRSATGSGPDPETRDERGQVRLGARPRHGHWSPWQRTKYWILTGFLVMAVCRVHWGTLFDPLVLLYRTTTTALLPAAQWGVEASSTAIYHYEPATAPPPIRAVVQPVQPLVRDYVSEPVYGFLRDQVFGPGTQAFLGSGLIFGLFLITLALNRYRRRFWCRYLCPLGALLGLAAWRPWLRRVVQPGTCNHCDLCGRTCPGAAARVPGDQWQASECLGCLNCTDACRRDSLRFTLAWPWRKEPVVETVNLSRRSVCGAALGGVAGLCLLRVSPQARGALPRAELIRPPGALPEREFLQRCTACGMCLRVCPTHGLQPALGEAGLEGLWTPCLVPRLGYCESECTACTHVCPTQALQPLTREQKSEVRIGLASFDVSRCIPYAYGRECIVCEEHCPVPDKAIYVIETEWTTRAGHQVRIRQPRVDRSRCTGCGICEHKCPLKDRPGIRVFSTNESRSDYQAVARDPEELPGGATTESDNPYANRP